MPDDASQTTQLPDSEREIAEAQAKAYGEEVTERQLQQIAQGINPDWERSFDHPIHGSLTFKAKLPDAATMTQHTIEMDRIMGARDLDAGAIAANPRGATLIYVAALAGMRTIFELPVVREEREENEETESVKVVRHRYDANAEIVEGFVVNVWMAFGAWRGLLATKLAALKKSSGETNGADSSESSTEPTASPSMTSA